MRDTVCRFPFLFHLFKDFKNVYTLFSAACGSNKSPKTQPTPSTEHQGPTQNPELRLKRHNPNPAGSFSQTHYYY